MANFDLTNLALQGCFGANKLIYDDAGLPSIMVGIPQFKVSDVIDGGADIIHPMFSVDGAAKDVIYISKFQNVVYNGRAYSLGGKDPAASLTWDTARGYCNNKGDGWHMMTAAEWAGIALWCKKNGFQPLGNNNYGKDASETLYKGIPTSWGTGNDEGKIYHIATGSGPLTYSHNNQPDGIWDLNGNVAEWGGGIRTVCGELQILVKAAVTGIDQSASSAEWKAIDATTGEFITPNGSGTTTNSIKVDKAGTGGAQYCVTITTTSSDFNCLLGSMTCTDDISDAAKATLRTYALLPEDGATAADYGNDRLYFNNVESERLFCCGGGYSNGSGAGVFCRVGGWYSRSYAGHNIGFRAAYYEP